VTLALIINGNTITTLTRADYTLFSCASPASDTTEKQDKYSTVINSWRGGSAPQRRNRVERKGVKRRSTSAVYFYGGSAPQRRNRVERKGAKRRSTSAVYIYPLRFAGRFLRQGCLGRPFFRFESQCSRDFSSSIGFLSCLKKLKCFFIYILYITDASFAFTLRSITDRC
jgi:hypothetical protein